MSRTWLRYGSRGEDVKQLQEMLGIKADGIFGQQTRTAVRNFQREHDLEVDGIVGDETWNALLIAADADAVPPEKVQIITQPFVQPVDYKQYDSRWKNIPYTSTGNPKQTIGSSGCGVTAMCDIIATMIDSRITPRMLAPMYVNNGFRTANTGTSWAAFPWTAKKFGFSFFKQTGSIEVCKKYLSVGAYAVCSMKKGYWTTGGHYICAWKWDDKYMYANDPASAKRTKQNLKDFAAECKQYFIFVK